MGKKTDRHKAMLDIIEKRNAISIKDLAELNNMSEVTTRRDVQEMEEMGLVENIRGMVFFRGTGVSDSYELTVATNIFSAEKSRIGMRAAEMLADDELIIIDNGTTTEQMARAIPLSRRLTILCYNINVMMNLYQKPNITLIFCGGFFHSQSQMFECPESLEIIRRTRASKVFVSAAGINDAMEVTCASEYEVTYKRELIKLSMNRILLVDSSKFDVVKPWYVGDLTDFETVITDKGLPESWQQRIRDKGIELILV